MFISLYISIWPNVAVLNNQYIKFFGQRTRQLLEIWYKRLNHFVKGYSEINTEIFAPVLFCFFRPRRQQANLALGGIPLSQNISLSPQLCLGEFKKGRNPLQMMKGENNPVYSTILNPIDADFEFEELDSVEFPETQYCSVKCQGDAFIWSCKIYM